MSEILRQRVLGSLVIAAAGAVALLGCSSPNHSPTQQATASTFEVPTTEAAPLTVDDCLHDAGSTHSAVTNTENNLPTNIAYGLKLYRQTTDSYGKIGTDVITSPQISDCLLPDGTLDKILVTEVGVGQGVKKTGVLTNMVVFEFATDGTASIVAQADTIAEIQTANASNFYVAGHPNRNYIGESYNLGYSVDPVPQDRGSEILSYYLTVQKDGGQAMPVMQDKFYPGLTINDVHRQLADN